MMKKNNFKTKMSIFLHFCVCLLLLSNFFELTDSTHVYHGTIKEDANEGDEVELDIPLNARQKNGNIGEICGYTTYTSISNLPFKVLLDVTTGEAKIVLARGFQLNFETTNEYDFEIAAHDCLSNSHAKREKVHIEVEDVRLNDDDAYRVDAIEGRFYDPLLHLPAIDKDGAGIRSCRYTILTPDVPFEIDSDGFLRNTAPLDYNKKQNYRLELDADDCDRAVVNIDVKPVCRPGWIGIQDRVEFSPREGRKLIAPAAELELCDNGCNLTRISVTAKLQTDHIGKGCDRDTYSLHSQRKLCGASVGTINLLPSPDVASWTREIPTDDGQESDQIFAFDGKTTAIEIPQTVISPNIGKRFSISLWMKREEEDGKTKGGNGNKEQILCHSDGEEMSRQHYSLHIHNCHLVLILRQEPDVSADPSSLQPSEWRWKTHEICDGRWHYYAINVDLPLVHLYVDGKHFTESKHNPEITDDWSLHPSKHVHFTKLVVGACWLGGKHRMGQFFHGYLAGLSLIKNNTESDKVIQCLNSCQEKLEFPGMDEMETGTTVSMNNEMTSISLSGINVESVEKLLHRISYINSRTFPTQGHRPFSLETHVMCLNGETLPVEMMKTLVMVTEAEKPIIRVSGLKVVDSNEHKMLRGQKIFHNLTIETQTKNEGDEKDDVNEIGGKYLLDSCLIRVSPQLNLDAEHFRYPENLLHQLGMEADISEDGLVIAGADKSSNYVEVLSGIFYVNGHPEELNSRSFVLTCTELNGRFVSNQLDVTIEVNHFDPKWTMAPQAIVAHKIFQSQLDIKRPEKSLKQEKNSDSQTVTGIVVMGVVCVGFVVLLVVLGIMRIRSNRHHSNDVNGDEKQEMEWDNSALTITVNPMDQEALYDKSEDVHGGESDDSEEEASLHENEADSSEEETPKETKTRELEWDDSTLSF